MQSPALGPPPKKRADGIILAGALFAPVSFCAIWLFAAGATRLLGSLESALALTAGFVAYLFFSGKSRDRRTRPRDEAARSWVGEGLALAESRDKLEALISTIPPDFLRASGERTAAGTGESELRIVGALIEGARLRKEESATAALNQGKVKAFIDSTPRLTELLRAHLTESNATTETAAIAIIRRITEVKDGAGHLVAELDKTKARVTFLHADAQSKIEETSRLLEGLTYYQLQLDREIKESIQSISAQIKELKSSTSIIQDVNAMTNVLAINAAIEAARAGKVGLGFAVVAGEVRKLSKQVAAAAADIDQKITVVSQMVAKVMKSIADLTKGEDEGQWLSKIAVALPRLSKDFGSTVAELEGYVGNTHEAVRAMLDAVIDTLGQAQFQDISRQQIEQVQKGIMILGERIKEVGEIMERDLSQPLDIKPFREIADSLESNYTMMVQRKVHRETLGGPSVDKDRAQPNIELF
jgi:methyl-accepting chemotaxis protein